MIMKYNDEVQKLVEVEKDRCIGCRVCMKNCPMLEHYCSSPKELLSKIHRDKEVDPIIPFSCALCGYCTQVCPKGIDLNEVFVKLRKSIVETNNGVPQSINRKPIEAHQKNSFSKLFATEVMGGQRTETTRVFFPGCSLSAYSPGLVMKTYEYLQKKLPNTGIMLNCCGKPTYAMGDIKTFNRYYADVQSSFDSASVKEVIVACQNCYHTLGENSPNQKVTSLWEILAEIGIPEDKIDKGLEIEIDFALHDPCPTRRNHNIHDAVREITQQLKLSIKEMEFSREKTLCCGSGGMLGVTNRELALKQMQKRANQTNEEYIISYCQECVDSMKQGGKQSIHLLDFLFNKEIYRTRKFGQKKIGSFKRWSNRFIAKIKVKKVKTKDR